MARENFKQDSHKEDLWVPALPEKMPAFTFWPVTLAAGTVFLLWGLITSPIISGVGLAVMFIALYGWIEEFRDD
jgi:hypothetical protein